MATTRVTFPGDATSVLMKELRESVASHFRDRGLSDKADAAMVARTVVMLGMTFGAYAAILTGRLSTPAMLGLAVVMGVGIAGIGFGISHDALHGAYSSRPWINRLLGFTFDFCGASSYLWKRGHNVAHHTYTNIAGVDGDIASNGLLRKTPQAEHRPSHRYQHLYAFPLYSLATLNWLFIKDYVDILRDRALPPSERVHSASDVAQMVVMKAVCYGWSIVLPLVLLPIPWWKFLIGFVAMHLTAGLILGIVFQLAHLVEGVHIPPPNMSGVIDESWVEHELKTTANFATHNRLLTWYIGALNYQIEHHLFPKICSTHYPAIRPIVREAARRHGLPYLDQPTLFGAIASHYRFMKNMGRPQELSPSV